jgi:hypothetical protein
MNRKRTAGTIKTPAVPLDQRHLKFSLEYLQPHHPKFHITGCCDAFFAALINEVVRYQTFTVDAFTDASPADHRHFIYFPETKEPNGFQGIDPSRDEELWTDSAWQFALPGKIEGSHLWRVYGFIDGEHFYIVWLDPFHALD